MRALPLALALLFASVAHAETLVIDAPRLFDGRAVIDDARMVVADGRIVAVGPRAEVEAPEGARQVAHEGAFVMPGLIAAHSHVGTVSGMEHGGRFYGRETVARDLDQFARYGVVAVNALGLNRPLFHALRTEFRGEGHGGADLYGAGAGVGVPEGAPPEGRMGVLGDQAARPTTADEARAAVRAMHEAGIDMVKIWVDPMGGDVPRMAGEVIVAAVEEGHRLGLPVAAHIHDLDDAKEVVRAGVDVVAHGVRDADVDEEFVALMRESGAWYVPTIQIDEANYIYAAHPEWLNDPFVRGALSPALAARIADPDWRAETLAGADGARRAVAQNMRNLERLHAAGVRIAFGTDSGATALRVPGLAEHRELELMVASGMPPLDALAAATSASAEMMGLADRGRLTPGARADFLILAADPSADIGASRSLLSVWKAGRETALAEGGLSRAGLSGAGLAPGAPASKDAP